MSPANLIRCLITSSGRSRKRLKWSQISKSSLNGIMTWIRCSI